MQITTQLELAGEIATGDAIRLADLAQRFHVCTTTCYRWIRMGLPGASGERVYLAALRRGKVWLTSSGAVARFLAELPQSMAGCPELPGNAPASPPTNPPPGELAHPAGS